MKNWPSGLMSLLESDPQQIFWADLYTITLASGTVYRFTNWEMNITIGSTTWNATGTSPTGVPLIRRSKLSQTIGTEVATMEITLADDGSTGGSSAFGSTPFNQGAFAGLVPILQMILNKQFDNAWCQLDIAASANPITDGWQGPGVYFSGRVVVDGVGRSIARLTIKDKRAEFNINVPRLVVQPGCRWTLYDSGCTLLRSNYQSSGTLLTNSNSSTLQTTLTQAGPVPGPIGPPVLVLVGGHNMPINTYFVKTTYLTGAGETLPSPESSITSNLNQLLFVGSPPAVAGAVGWNCYVSLSPNDEQLQNFTPLLIGQGFTMPDYQQNPAQGIPAPTEDETGYFDLGYLTFNSGSNSGYTASVKQYYRGTNVVGLENLDFELGTTFNGAPSGWTKTANLAFSYSSQNGPSWGGTHSAYTQYQSPGRNTYEQMNSATFPVVPGEVISVKADVLADIGAQFLVQLQALDASGTYLGVVYSFSGTGTAAWQTVTAVTGGGTIDNNGGIPSNAATAYVALVQPPGNATNAQVWFDNVRITESSGTIVLHRPLPYPARIGDTFTIYPGCDKRLATCRNKFNNLINYGGQPFVPPPEQSI